MARHLSTSGRSLPHQMMNGRQWWKIFVSLGVDGHGSLGFWDRRGKTPGPLALSIRRLLK